MMRPVSFTGLGRSVPLMAGCAALAAGIALLPAAARTDTVSDRAAVTGALEASAAGWSNNELAKFMAVYEDAPSTTYLKGSTIVRGFQAIKAMYAVRFSGASGGSGKLSLDVMDFRPLGANYALCIGRFRLAEPGPSSRSAAGMFTLVFHRTAAGWKIASDHTSS